MSSLLNSVNRVEYLSENQYIGQSSAALLADIIHYTENQEGLDFDSVLRQARNIAVRERVAIINRFGEMIYNPTLQERRRSRRMVEFSVLAKTNRNCSLITSPLRAISILIQPPDPFSLPLPVNSVLIKTSKASLRCWFKPSNFQTAKAELPLAFNTHGLDARAFGVNSKETLA